MTAKANNARAQRAESAHAHGQDAKHAAAQGEAGSSARGSREPVVSVIMPVYNAGPFLHDALKSVLEQDLKDFELLLIDDGSTDASGAICDEFAAQDKRVHVIHKQNGGACQARNVGIDRACGTYIAFADDDDICLPGYLSVPVELAQKTGAACVRFGRYQQIIRDDTVVRTTSACPQEELIVTRDTFAQQYYRLWNGCGGGVWVGLYRRDFLKAQSLHFNEDMHKGYEDDLFNIECYRQAFKQCLPIALCPARLYVWRQQQVASNSLRLSPEKMKGLERAVHAQALLMREIGVSDDCGQGYSQRLVEYMLGFIAEMYRANPTTPIKQTLPWLESLACIYRENSLNVDKRYLKIKARVTYSLLMHHRYRLLFCLARTGYRTKDRLAILGTCAHQSDRRQNLAR